MTSTSGLLPIQQNYPDAIMKNIAKIIIKYTLLALIALIEVVLYGHIGG